jgi:hypothetical protein
VESELLHCFQQKVHLTFVIWFSSVSRPVFAGTTDDDESAISTDISEADTDFNIPSAEEFQSTSSLVTTEIAPNSEET